ncbi:pilus assembly protein [Pseudogemmobacter sonorensis]|uniref:TadE/TadG family type IV pilus assembly protein n=1 Tax=Pseudogemmobacter sonorensis TaxID=2989681 RepID=UPI00369B8FFB
MITNFARRPASGSRPLPGRCALPPGGTACGRGSDGQRSGARWRARQRIGAFLHEEDGVMATLVLLFFFLMIVTGGIAVDVMRFETRRVAVQNTLDRATLAAASLQQTLDPEEVVRDYFDKANLGQALDGVDVVDGMNSRRVTADASVLSRNYFMSILGEPDLRAFNVSQAEQSVTNVEIALVLDISGSMYNTISRINNLKVAAKDFVDTVLENDLENRISISIVPYNGQVNLGPELFGKFNATHTHGYAESYCLDLPDSTFTSTGVSRTTAFPQTPFIDGFSTTQQTNGYYDHNNSDWSRVRWDSARSVHPSVFCAPHRENYVLVHTNDIDELHDRIDGLIAIGATSIDLGMKWGTTLLDPSSQAIVAQMAASGSVPSEFADRPAPYTDTETLKVIVLMTDGENFEAEYINPAYRTGISDIWRANDGRYSFFDGGRVNNSSTTTRCNSRPFYVPHLNAWHSRPWNGTTPGSSACYSPTASYSNTTQQTWPEVWQRQRMQWVAWQLYARRIGGNNATARNNAFVLWRDTFRSTTSISDMDDRLEVMCETARQRGILVYGIAFEAPSNGRDAIRNCVSEPHSTYFFDVSGLQIRTAFALIASNLSQLRLTQ